MGSDWKYPSILSWGSQYLGHCIDAMGLHATLQKLAAIQKVPSPSLQELRSFRVC